VAKYLVILGVGIPIALYVFNPEGIGYSSAFVLIIMYASLVFVWIVLAYFIYKKFKK